MSSRKLLLLWDIDGTLIWGGGGGEQALITAMKNEFCIDVDLSRVDYAGRTDRKIAHMLLDLYAIERSDASVNQFIKAYLDALVLPDKDAYTHPGINQIVKKVHDNPNMHQGLLTGNMQRGAQIKLSHFDLWKYFPFGGFADDSEDRNELGPHALLRAQAHANIDFEPDQVFVIGDTPHDIECGKVIGANTIAVATGNYTVDTLQSSQPTVCFENLEAVQSFFNALN